MEPPLHHCRGKNHTAAKKDTARSGILQQKGETSVCLAVWGAPLLSTPKAQGQMEDNIGVVMRNRDHGRKEENETMVFEIIYIQFVAPALGFLFVVSVAPFCFSLSDQA